MNIAAAVPTSTSITRPSDNRAILAVNSTTAGDHLVIRAGTAIRLDGRSVEFASDETVILPALTAGEDYGVKINADGKPFASLLGPENPIDAGWIAGFHYAPGGNATARAGGNDTPAINPSSIWDLGFRATCPDPRGMALVDADGRRFWLDIYLLGVDHKRNGTSRCGVKTADGNSLDRLNYHDATAIMAWHGKRLPTYDEFRFAATGVTERSSADRHPITTGLDAARTSRFGLMQATGNLWIWGTDGDPEDPRPSFFGGSWLHGARAGSRYACLDYWAGNSYGSISARGASDHLAPE